MALGSFFNGKTVGVIFDAHNGNELVVLENGSKNDNCGAIAFSHDGKRVVTLQEKFITIWDTEKGSMLLPQIEIAIENKNDCDICFSQDDKTIVAGLPSGQIHIYSAETRKLLKPFQGDKDGIQWLSFTPDGKTLISYAGQTVKFWVENNSQS